MGGRDMGRRLLVGVISLTLSAACAAGVSPTPTSATLTPTSLPSVSAATPTAAIATPAPTPSPTAITHGPVTVVAGTAVCPSIDFGTVTTDSTGVQHSRGGTLACTQTVNDPRVSGAYTATWNLDWWGTADHSNGALVQWGTVRLVNAGGAWEGRATGVYSSERGDTIAHWYTGTGKYAGLSYFELWTGGLDGTWTIQGQIFPGNPPTP